MAKIILTLLLAWVVASMPLLAQVSLPPNLPSEKFHLYLLSGQSNMAGRGRVEPVDQVPHPRVWMLTRDNKWVPATDPMHFDKPDVIGVGPGLTFGKKMAEADTAVFIGLIPAAAGGSAIDSWQPGGYHDQTQSHPYDEAIARAHAAQQTGTLHGILWHQGESDSKPELANTYQKKVTQLIERFRTEFHDERLPVVVGTLGDFYVSHVPDASQINSLLRQLPTIVPYSACVDASGLTDKGDQTHFDTKSARELGSRYADAMLKLESGRKK